MGVINVSPESFHAGSVYHGDEAVLWAALGMVEAGAALIDVGARSSAPYLPTGISEGEETALAIDGEIKRIVVECASRARQILEENIEKLHALARALLERESLDSEEIARILRARPFSEAPAPA